MNRKSNDTDKSLKMNDEDSGSKENGSKGSSSKDSDSKDSGSKDSGSKVGVIVGSCVGAILFVVILGALIIWRIRYCSLLYIFMLF